MRWLCVLAALFPAAAAAGERPVLGPFPVWARDYSFLKDPSQRTDGWDRLKYLPLSDSTYVSLSGEVRVRYEDFFRQPQLGLSGPKRDDYLLTRGLLGADVHLGQNVRAFVQVGYHAVGGKAVPATATEQSGVDLQQAFVELKGNAGSVRVGRQEIMLGSQRLVALRDGPNIRQTFDAVRYTGKIKGAAVTAFASHPVRIGAEDFDDTSETAQDLTGLYIILPDKVGLGLDIYALSLRKKTARFAQGLASERRQSYGIRLFSKAPAAFDYNVEAVWQDGRFGRGRISAWTVATDIGWTQGNWRFRPRFGLKTDIASGDDDLTDNRLGTFNALFPKGNYFTDNAILGPANLVDLNPNLTLTLTASFSVALGADVAWRHTTHDAVYRLPNVPFANTAGRPGKYIGTQYYVAPAWQVTPHIMVSSAFVYFETGTLLQKSGARDSVYAGTWLNYRF